MLEGKIGKEIPESSRFKFLGKIFASSFVLSEVKDNTSAFVENTISISPKVARAKFLGNDRLFYVINISKFGTFKKSFAMITSLNFTLDAALFCWYEQKWFLWTTAAQSAEKHEDERGVTWYLQREMYT